MKHRWWLMNWLIGWLEREVRRDPLIKEGSFSTFKTWRQKITRGKIVSEFLEQQGGDFYAMMEIADNVDVFSYYDSNSPTEVKINLDWECQTEARSLFGGVFPEHVKRQVRTDGMRVGRTYTWSGDLNDVQVKVIVGFWREAIDGEEVDGCMITLRRHVEIERPFRVESLRAGSLYASASCPIKKVEGA